MKLFRNAVKMRVDGFTILFKMFPKAKIPDDTWNSKSKQYQ